MIDPNVFFSTKNNNSYFFNYHLNNVLISNPILKYINDLITLNKTHQLKNSLENGANVPNLGFCDKESIRYYMGKYKFFESMGLLKPMNTDVSKKYITEDEIKHNIKTIEGIVFEVTENCNLACEYCCFGLNYKGYNSRECKNLDFSTAKATLDFFLENKSNLEVPFDIGFYGGEPLMNMELIKEIINYIETKYTERIKFTYRLTTNGILLNKYIKYLTQKKIEVSVSLDGNKDHNIFRKFKNGQESFTTVFNNVKNVKKQYPEYFKNYISFLCTYNKKSDMNEIIQFFYKEFELTNNIMFSDLTFTNLKVEEENYFREKYYKGLTFDLRVLKNNIENNHFYFDNGITISFLKEFSGFYCENLDLYLADEIQKQISCACIPFTKPAFITVEGKIIPCPYISQKEEIGKIIEGKVEINYKFLEDKYNKLTKEQRNKCSTCYNYRWCDTCVFSETLNEKKECYDYHNYTQMKEYLSNQMSLLEDVGTMIEKF